jgi:hypothetical protein
MNGHIVKGRASDNREIQGQAEVIVFEIEEAGIFVFRALDRPGA